MEAFVKKRSREDVAVDDAVQHTKRAAVAYTPRAAELDMATTVLEVL